jgi:hypothetical protein
VLNDPTSGNTSSLSSVSPESCSIRDLITFPYYSLQFETQFFFIWNIDGGAFDTMDLNKN